LKTTEVVAQFWGILLHGKSYQIHADKMNFWGYILGIFSETDLVTLFASVPFVKQAFPVEQEQAFSLWLSKA
jgi:hypothetical protein